MRKLLFTIALLALVSGVAIAHDAGESARPPATEEDRTAVTKMGDEAVAGPVAVPEPTEKAMRYYRSGNRWWLFNQIWSLVLPAIFLFTGLSAGIRNVASRIGRNWFFTIGVYFALFITIVFVVELPLSYFQGYARPHAYDLSTQTFGKWAGDSLKGLMVSVVGGFILLWIPYGLLRLSPRRWWFYMGLAMIPILFVVYLVSPVLVDPLFREYAPLEDKALEARVLDLAERAGIEDGDVYEMKLSVDSRVLTAYVTGFLNSKRVVLSDNIIAAMDEDELLFVVGHESGHYVLGHLWRSVAVLGIVFMVALWVVHRFAAGLIGRYKGRFGFDHLSDVASWPLILLLFSLASLVVTPAIMTYSRWQEGEADRFALEITQSNHAAASAFVKLQHTNLGNPNPGLLYKLWRSQHPTLAERIEFCNTYRPWETGDPLEYADRFK